MTIHKSPDGSIRVMQGEDLVLSLTPFQAITLARMILGNNQSTYHISRSTK